MEFGQVLIPACHNSDLPGLSDTKPKAAGRSQQLLVEVSGEHIPVRCRLGRPPRAVNGYLDAPPSPNLKINLSDLPAPRWEDTGTPKGLLLNQIILLV